VTRRARGVAAAIAAAVVLAGAGGCAHHAAPAPAPAPPAPVSAAPDTTVRGWTVGNLAVGTAVVVVRARYGGRVYLGVGTATATMALTFTAADVDRFVADARALLAARTPGRQPVPSLAEPGSGRAMSFSRVRHAGASTYHFFFADETLRGFPLPATVVEARAVLSALARGAATAREATPSSP